MTELIRVRLTWGECLTGAVAGVMRNVAGLKNHNPLAGQPDDSLWVSHIEGACGEMAFAKYKGLFWAPTIGDTEAPNDVGVYQVRTITNRSGHCLILRDRDFRKHSPDKIFISVKSFMPEFEIHGWIPLGDGKQQEWLSNGGNNRPPAYFVPRDALRPMSTIPIEAEAAA